MPSAFCAKDYFMTHLFSSWKMKYDFCWTVFFYSWFENVTQMFPLTCHYAEKNYVQISIKLLLPNNNIIMILYSHSHCPLFLVLLRFK